MPSLGSAGGVETRLNKQLKYLSGQAFQCMILTSGNDFPPLQQYPNFQLIFDAGNFSDLLLDIVRSAHADFIEFQIKETRYLKKINFSKLRKYCRTGLCIHNDNDNGFNDVNFDSFDYILRANATFGYHFLEAVPHIPNWVEKTTPVWKYCNQKKALFISRLSDDKLPTLVSFISACQAMGYDFEIAGNFSGPFYSHKKIRNFMNHLPPEQYIGPVNTMEFLEKSNNNYLFVGGVGQVSIEAASFGIPSLVCTHLENFSYSRFVTKENIDSLITNNFVINTHRYMPDSQQGSISHFMDCIKNRHFSEFQVAREIEEKLSQESAMAKYLTILNSQKLLKTQTGYAWKYGLNHR